MSPYRHRDHAGNHGDVLKHLVLVRLLDHLVSRPDPLLYLDAHAGAGGYALPPRAPAGDRGFAAGIGRLWRAGDLPPALSRYVSLVRAFNGDGELTGYPGSPWLAARLLRSGDRLRLYERDPGTCAELQRCLAGDGRATVCCGDGFAGCLALPGPEGWNGLVLLDPPYADPADYGRVADTLRRAYTGFPGWVFALWYPVADRGRVDGLKRALRAMGPVPLDHYELAVAPDRPGNGMTGSGMVVVNPPPGLAGELGAILPGLARRLGEAGGGLAGSRFRRRT